MKGFIKGLITGLAVSVFIVVFYFLGSMVVDGIWAGFSPANVQTRIDRKLNDIDRVLKRNYYEDFDVDELETAAVKAYLDALGDPYTVYYTKDEFDSFLEEIEGTYEGIGAYIGYGKSKDELIIVAPMEDSPSEKAGLKAGDVFVKVDGVDVAGYTTDKLVKLIKGEENTDVKILVKRGDATREITVTRQKIDVPTVKSKILDNNIGYIRITSFDHVTDEQFVKHFDKIKNDGIEGLIIDLRYNPGGLTNVVTRIADELIPKDLLVYYTEYKSGKKEMIKTRLSASFDKPIVVLINEGSASASEILSGALKDHNLATLVGTRTFGKGLVQSTYDLKDGSALKVTIAKYFTPAGNYIHGKGIEPDVKVELDIPKDEDIDKSDKSEKEIKDNQLEKAIEVIKEKLKK